MFAIPTLYGSYLLLKIEIELCFLYRMFRSMSLHPRSFLFFSGTLLALEVPPKRHQKEEGEEENLLICQTGVYMP